MSDESFLLILNNGCDIYGGPLNGTEYEMVNACQKCGTGARQSGPLVLKSLRVTRHEIFYTLNNEILISPRVADALQSAGMRCCGPVIESASHKLLQVSQLVAEATLPKFSPETTGVTRERPCGECDRDGHFGIGQTPLRLAYAAPPPLEADLYSTLERFGNSRLRVPFKDSVFAPPMYVASKRLHAALSALRLKGLAFEPVVWRAPEKGV